MFSCNSHARWAVLPLAALMACSSFAQQDATLAPVVVTATRVETPLADVLLSVDVLNREDIERTQAASLADLLQGLPGYEFGRNGGPGTVTSFFLRGHNSANLVILVDGVRTAVDGIGSLSAVDLPLSEIERVEVLRGDASALYGDAANGGVIHIITRRPGNREYLGLGIGDHGARHLRAGIGRQSGNSSFGLSLLRQDSAKLSAMDTRQRPAANPDGDQSVTEALSARFAHRLSNDTEFDARLSRETSRVAYDEDNFGYGSPTDTYDMKRVTDRAQLVLKTRPAQHWKTELAFGHTEQDIEDRKNGVLKTSAYAYGLAKSRHDGLRWTNTLAYGASGYVILGVEGAKENYEADATLSGYRTDRHMSAVFAGLTQELGPVTLQANWRHDRVRLADEVRHTSKRWVKNAVSLGAGYEFGDGWKASASVASGFRVPTSYDISRSPGLRPEEYLNRELGVSYRSGPAQTRVSAFWNQAKDMIITHPSTYAQTNTDAKNRGIEWSGSYTWGDTKVAGALTWQSPRNLSTGLPLARRGKQLASVGVEQGLGTWTLGGKASYQSARRDQDFNNNMLGAYTVVDLFASYRLNRDWKLNLKLENVGDKDYQLAYGYQTPRRGLFVSLDYAPR